MLKSDSNSIIRNFAALVDFANLINSSLDINFTLHNLLLTCFGKFQCTKGIIAIVEDQKLILKNYKGFSKNIEDCWKNFDLENYKANESFKKFLSENKISAIQEIKSNEKVLGLILLGKKFTGSDFNDEDQKFLETLTNIAATAIENSLTVEKLKSVNKQLDSKVNQLSSLFDLSKEFSGVLDTATIVKLLVYSIIGQLFVSKFSVVYCKENQFDILESKFDRDKLFIGLENFKPNDFDVTLQAEGIEKSFPSLKKLGIELIVPMKINNETRGLILLGKRIKENTYSKSDQEYISSIGSLAIISITNAQLFQETLEKQRLEKDLEIARNIQKNLLPKDIIKTELYDIAAFNQSAKQVGGDYFDVLKLSSKKILFAIADVSGKGVQAALLMANLQAFLKSIAKQNISLVEASNLINDLVSENVSNGSFITFFWGILDNESKKLKYVNAGHNPPVLVRDKKIIKLKKGGMILGVMKTIIPYESEEIELQDNDKIILFTDGITEAMDVNDVEYSDERLEKLVIDLNEKDSQSFLNKIIDDVKEYTKDAEQSDDITCLIISVK